MSEPATTTVPPEEAEELLASVERARDAADRRAGAYWFAPVLAGALLWVSAYFFSVWDGAGVTVFWLVVAPSAYVAVRRYERTQLNLSGAISRPPAYQQIAGLFVASCVVSGAIGGATGEPDVIGYGPLIGLLAACAVAARRHGNRHFAVWAFLVAAFTLLVVVFAGSVEYPARFFAVAIGANLFVEGFSERNRRGA
jgi:hypothetical protein